MTDEQYKQLVKLLKRNIELAEQNLHTTKRVRLVQILGSVWGWVKLLILAAAIIASTVLLPRWIQGKISVLQETIVNSGPEQVLKGLGKFAPEEVIKSFQNRVKPESDNANE